MLVPEEKLPPTNCRSGQVSLRDVMPADLPLFFEHQCDLEAVRMADFPSRDKPDFTAHWQKIMADDQVIIKTILYNGQVVGNIVSFIVAGRRQVGYWLGREYWARGIATAALEEFLVHLPQRPMFAEVASHNRISQRVLEKCGFERAPIVSSTPPAGASVVDDVLIYILK